MTMAQSTTITPGIAGNVQIPNLTYAQVTAIPSPQRGMQVFDTDYGCIRMYNGVDWRCNDTPANESNILTTAIQAISNNGSVSGTISESTIVVGNFTGSITFGGTTLTSAGGQDVFMVKYDVNGNLQWAKRFGGASGGGLSGDEAITDIVVDPFGIIYITGRLGSSVMTGAITTPATSGTEGFVAKFDATGTILAISLINGSGSNSFDSLERLSVVGNSVYVSGYQSGGVTIGTTNVTTPRFIAKYNNSLVAQWAYETTATINDIACSSNKVVATGIFSGTINFGNTSYTASGTSDCFVLCLDDIGVVQWSDAFGSNGTDRTIKILIKQNNKVVIAGVQQLAIYWGDQYLFVPINYDIFLLQYSTQGVKEWARMMSGSSQVDNVLDLKTDPIGNIYMLGTTSEKLILDSKILNTNSTSNHSFVAKFNTDGFCSWVKSFRQLNPNTLSLGSIGNGILRFSGTFNGNNVRFGHTSLSSTSATMFLATITEN